MLKRAFIPPEYRPYVRGSRIGGAEATAEFSRLFASLQDDVQRRQLIYELATEKTRLGELDPKWVARTLRDFFPGLGG